MGRAGLWTRFSVGTQPLAATPPDSSGIPPAIIVSCAIIRRTAENFRVYIYIRDRDI